MRVLGLDRASVDRARDVRVPPVATARQRHLPAASICPCTTPRIAGPPPSPCASWRALGSPSVCSGPWSVLESATRPRPYSPQSPAEDKRLRSLRDSTRRATRCGFGEPVPRRRSVVETSRGCSGVLGEHPDLGARVFRLLNAVRRTESTGIWCDQASEKTSSATQRAAAETLIALLPPFPPSRTAPSGPRPPSREARPR